MTISLVQMKDDGGWDCDCSNKVAKSCSNKVVKLVEIRSYLEDRPDGIYRSRNHQVFRFRDIVIIFY